MSARAATLLAAFATAALAVTMLAFCNAPTPATNDDFVAQLCAEAVYRGDAEARDFYCGIISERNK